jgi:predicted Ser/Thr protein kinase
MDVYQPVDIGSDFLGYRIEELIGRGGMGVVYRAYDLRLKRPVALKLVAPSLARDDRFRERFARESELVMSLEHPNVVPIYDAGDVDGRVYLAMRLVDGTDLGSLLRSEGALEPARAVAICTQIAAALDAAHQRGLVHRDVKPSNILLDSSGHVYLADFGLTRRLDDEAGEASEDGSLGTPAYLAPEQLEGRPVDSRVDVYGLGCVLYECLTGEPVFPRRSRLAVAWAHLEEEPPRASSRRAELPEAVDGVVSRAMAKEPEQRFATCSALVAAAQDALGLGQIETSRRRRSLLLAGAVGLAFLAAGVAIALTVDRGAGKSVAAQLYAGPNTLARIDSTGKLSAVFPVGADPVVAAANDYTVWVYSRGDGAITEIDGYRSRRVETTHVSLPAECCGLYTGPVLAADATGAWFVEGGNGGHQTRLVHLFVGDRPPVAYPLAITATGVAVPPHGGTVWVVGHNKRGDEVLRVDPTDGHVTATAHFPTSAQIDSIAFGYGRVWVLSSAQATLYKIDPRSPTRPAGTLVVAHSRAARPEIMPRGRDLWVRVADAAGTGYSIDPHSLRILWTQQWGRPDFEENEGQLGSLWWYDWRTGEVYRQETANTRAKKIHVTRSTPGAGGPCLTSIAVALGSIWVTVAPSSHHPVCPR